MLVHHVLDSLAVLHFIPKGRPCSTWVRAAVPGAAGAVMRPDASEVVSSIDAVRKRRTT